MTVDHERASQLLESHASTECEACGSTKHRFTIFCSVCFSRLPNESRDKLLSRRIGGGYEEAYAEALEVLGKR